MVRKGESTGALLRTLSDSLRWRFFRALTMAAAACRIAGAAIRRDDYVRSHSLEGCGEGARRRAPPDDIDFVPSPSRAASTPPLSASDLECSPLAPTDTSDRNYALTT
ncbi:unnamed protein product, partial [Brenthis ino]